jgi:deoxyribodipyrimidine photo-lyase
LKICINIFWFKKDLRIIDNEALLKAIKEQNKLLMIFSYHELLKDNHYSDRHLNFINESLQDLNLHLKKFQTRIHFFDDNIISIIKKLKTKFDIDKVYSHTETGLEKSYKNDLKFKDYHK